MCYYTEICSTLKLAVQFEADSRQMKERADDPDERHVTRPLQMKGSSSRNKRNSTNESCRNSLRAESQRAVDKVVLAIPASVYLLRGGTPGNRCALR